MNLVVSALHFPWDTLDACFREARQTLGLDGVELSFHSSLARPHCTREDLEQIAPLREQHGVSVCAHIWDDLAALDAAAACASLDAWRRVAVRAGVTGLVVHGGSHPDRREGLRRVAHVLETVLPAFERSGVNLLLENHYAYDYRDCHELFSEPWEFAELFQRLSSPALRACFDTGHAHLTRNGEELLRALAPQLAHVHLADNHGEHDDHCMYGEGTVPWESYFARLAEDAFDGTFCVEFPVREDRAPFAACIARLRRQWRSTTLEPPDAVA